MTPKTPYNKKVIKETPMVTDTVQDKQIRRSIIQSVKDMDLRLLKRICYETKCEELGVYPDSWNLYPED